MIYAFIGSDTEKVHTKARAWIQAAREKDTERTYVRIVPDTVEEAQVRELLGGQSLFAQKILVSLDGVFSSKQGAFLFDYLPTLKESENVFAIIDTGLKKKEYESIEKTADKVFRFDTKDTGPDWSSFAVGNALAAGDARGAWVSFVTSRRNGLETEVLGGIVHAKLRKLMQSGNGKVSSAHARELSREFIERYALARSGEWELDEGIEHFLLTEVPAGK